MGSKIAFQLVFQKKLSLMTGNQVTVFHVFN